MPRCNIETWYYGKDTPIMFAPEIEATYPECQGQLPDWFWDNFCFAKAGNNSLWGADAAGLMDVPCQYFGGGDDAYCPCVGEGRQWANIMWDTREDAAPICGDAATSCEYIMPEEDATPIDKTSTTCSTCLASCQGLSSCCTGTGCICQDECLPDIPDCTGTGLTLYCDSDGFCLCI